MAPRRALLIDGLGTLVALTPPAPVLVRELAARFGLEISAEAAQHALATEIRFYRAHMGSGRDTDSLTALRRRCGEVLRDALPAPARRLSIDEATEALLSALRFEPYPDAREALVRARTTTPPTRVIVVSNWDVSLLGVLELVGLAPLVDGVVTSAVIGAAKPAPLIFEHALSLAGVSASRALHVGDSPDEDVAGALAIGIRPVLLDRARARPAVPAGVARIAGLAELPWPP